MSKEKSKQIELGFDAISTDKEITVTVKKFKTQTKTNKKSVNLLVPELNCKHCSHTWRPRYRNVTMCPNCKTRYWWKTRAEVKEMKRIDRLETQKLREEQNVRITNV